jgi:hypothetical protein
MTQTIIDTGDDRRRNNRPNTSSSSSSSGDDGEIATAETPLLWREPPEEPARLYRQNIIILIFVIVFLMGIGTGLFLPPEVALMEYSICHHYHPEVLMNGGSILNTDPICKKDPVVQDTLAMIRGWQSTFSGIPG